MVLKTLQMFEAYYDLAPAFGESLLKARNSNKNAKRGEFHNNA